MEDKERKDPQAEQEEETIRAIGFCLFNEWIAGLKSRDMKTVKDFCTRTGATESSPLVMMYEAFLGGPAKGLEISLNAEYKPTEQDKEASFLQAEKAGAAI